MDLTYSGATGPGIGSWMVFGSRESSSGGPFFRDIQNQAGGDQEVYNYMNSGHNQTEANRLGVLHGPYALVFTTAPLRRCRSTSDGWAASASPGGCRRRDAGRSAAR